MKRLPWLAIVALFAGGCLFSSSGEQTNSKSDMGDIGDTANLSDAQSDGTSGDTTIPENCGDGQLQADEVCDPMLPPQSGGACPTSCDDGLACTTDTLVGSAAACTAACQSLPIEVCENGDGCCPGDCSADNDTDCDDSAVCGDGVLTGAETCDPGIAVGEPGACPVVADCAPIACSTPRIVGDRTNCSAVCAYVPITTCTTGDGCCPAGGGCDSTSDQDCSITCGDGVIDPGEACDGNCPTVCDDGNACTTDTLEGSAASCDAECAFTSIAACVNGDGCCPAACNAVTDSDCSATCGNNMLDALETCDNTTTTLCPTTCDDGDTCTNDASTGSPLNCNVTCTNTAKTGCKADGCCLPSCNANNDVDCAPFCGNGVKEAGESCDGNCPTTCDDGIACTSDTTMGSAAACNLVCGHTNITSCTSGDGCCAPGCNAVNDTDCGPVCPNGVLEGAEICDGDCPASCNDQNSCTTDVRSGSAAMCNVQCTNTPISACIGGDGCCPAGCTSGNDNDCSTSCGNGVVDPGETCDPMATPPCPTSCMGACNQLVTTGPCNVSCQPISGCVPCTLGGNCPCAAGQVCTGGKCQSSAGGACSSACVPNAYCVAKNTGMVCSANVCRDCANNSHCEPYEACQASNCITPATCNLARNPDDYCVYQGLGTACDTVNQRCTTACMVPGDCLGDETCVGGFCLLAQTCNEASDPDAFCGFGEVCIGEKCRVDCGMTGACDCDYTETCTVDPPSNRSYCNKVKPPRCTAVCSVDREAYCQFYHAPGWYCSGASSAPDGCQIGVIAGDDPNGPDLGP